MNIAIITARGGSESIPNKNVYSVKGSPLVSYPVAAAKAAARIGHVFVSTDDAEIARIASAYGAAVLERPDHLTGSDVNHGDVIQNAVKTVDRSLDGLKNVVVLLGNTVMVDGELIDESLRMLEENPTADSVMSVWEAADDHPLRAMEITDGQLRPYGGGPRDVSTNRQAYPKAYYYDQGVWTFRKECAFKREGPNPWWWMGKRSLPIVRNWATGRDIHTHLDIRFSEMWIEQYPEIKSL